MSNRGSMNGEIREVVLIERNMIHVEIVKCENTGCPHLSAKQTKIAQLIIGCRFTIDLKLLGQIDTAITWLSLLQ